MLKELHVYLIKPTQYDDDGYVVRHWRGVLPSNTLACMAGLTDDVVAQERLGESLQVKIHLLDESVDRVPVKHICRSQRGDNTKTIVCLVGVQTNQFPRAADLARMFRRAGLTVMIGGFHVSGYLALLPEIPPDIQQLMDEGVTIVKGEIEETWGDLLCDAVNGRLKPLYDFLNNKPDLYDKPIPTIRKKYLRKFVVPNFGTIDCGRGCPFECSFCTIINVQGRKMRSRSAKHIAGAVRHNYRAHGISFYFFTDDNFARNKNWAAIFDALIHLREEEQIPVEFMMQVDVLSWKIKDFVAKARRAGCINVFIGMESVNTDNLKAAGKKQNHVNELAANRGLSRQRDIHSRRLHHRIPGRHRRVRPPRPGIPYAGGAARPRFFLHADALARLSGPPGNVASRGMDASRLQPLRFPPRGQCPSQPNGRRVEGALSRGLAHFLQP